MNSDQYKNLYAEQKNKGTLSFRSIFYCKHEKIWNLSAISSMPGRCCAACVAASGGYVEDILDIDLDSIKYKGSLIFGSAYIFSKDYDLVAAFTKKPFPKLWKSKSPVC